MVISGYEKQQVVVSAATGLFGVGKNVLDVWCNTTFLGEDGEIFYETCLRYMYE